MTPTLSEHESPIQITLKSTMQHNVIGALGRSYPEVAEGFRRARVCVVQCTHWPRDPKHRTDSWRRVVQRVRNRVLCTLDTQTIPHGVQPVLLCYLRVELAYALRGRELTIAGMPVLGWMGLYEGGMDFFGADDSRIRTEQWDEARDYALNWCAQRWKN